MKKYRRILLPLTLVCMVVLLVGGATMAVLTSHVGAPNAMANEENSGTVIIDVNRDWGEYLPGPMFYTTPQDGATPEGELGMFPHGYNDPCAPWEPGQPLFEWAPGDPEDVRQLDVNNNGSLAAVIDNFSAELTGLSQADASIFADKLLVSIKVSGSPKNLFEGSLSELLGNGYNVSPGAIINASAITHLTFSAQLKKDAPDELQGENPLVKFWVHASQKANITRPTNLGFELGNLTGWNIDSQAQYVGVTGANSDTSPRWGNFMAQLGADSGGGQPNGSNKISTEFVATQNNLNFAYNIFTYDYPPYDNVGYKITLTSNGQIIGEWNTPAPGTGSGKESTGWQNNSVNLSSYLGQTIKVEITAGGTSDGLYATYAYFDFQQ